MDKQEMRTSAIMRLKGISETERQSIEQRLSNQLINSNMWKHVKMIGITISQGFEWDTRRIIETAWRQNKTVCVPKCDPKDKKLTFYQLDSYDQLEVVYYNLLEPKPEITKKVEKASIDLLIVPGILFDKEGYRIGFGGGYYDRFLSDFPNVTASLSSAIQIVDYIPAEPFDIPVHHLITDKQEES